MSRGRREGWRDESGGERRGKIKEIPMREIEREMMGTRVTAVGERES